jgi:MFS superfamily sulfate permease-like transporter
VNEVDMSALESLEAVNERLRSMGVKLHLSEVKGPVTDRLKRSHFLDDLTGHGLPQPVRRLARRLTGARPDPGLQAAQ